MKEITIESQDKTFSKTYVFTPAQQRFTNAIFKGGKIDTKYREFSFFGGVRCGKSFITQFIVWYICSTYPNCSVLYIRDTYDQLKDSVIKQFNDDFSYTGTFNYQKSDRTAYFQNNSVIKFRAFDTDGRGVLSTEYDIVAFCQAEDIPEDLFLMSLSRLSGQALPKPLLFTEGNPASTWPKLRYKDVSRETLESKNIFFCEVGTEENKANLPEGYLEFLMANYPKQWIARYLNSEWTQIDEMVFSEFEEHVHIIDPFKIPANYRKYIGMDYGWKNPSAMTWQAVDYDGNIYIFDEFKQSQQTAQDLEQVNKRHGILSTICDYSIKAPDRDGKSLWDDLSMAGIRLIESNKDELRNLTAVNGLFKQRKLFIFRNCHELIKEIKAYKWKRLKVGDQKNFPETPIDKDNHLIDSMLYGLAYIEDFKSQDPSVRSYKQSLEYATIKRDYGKKWTDLG